MVYAEGTTVAPEKSALEIQMLLKKYGAEKYSSGFDESSVHVVFTCKGLTVQLTVKMPSDKDPRFSSRRTSSRPRRRWNYTTNQMDVLPSVDKGSKYDAEVRRLWRALALVIKAKLEAVESGITTFEQEFLAHIITGDGQTVGQRLIPQLAEAAKTGSKFMLPAIGGTSR